MNLKIKIVNTAEAVVLILILINILFYIKINTDTRFMRKSRAIFKTVATLETFHWRRCLGTMAMATFQCAYYRTNEYGRIVLIPAEAALPSHTV